MLFSKSMLHLINFQLQFRARYRDEILLTHSVVLGIDVCIISIDKICDKNDYNLVSYKLLITVFFRKNSLNSIWKYQLKNDHLYIYKCRMKFLHRCRSLGFPFVVSVKNLVTRPPFNRGFFCNRTLNSSWSMIFRRYLVPNAHKTVRYLILRRTKKFWPHKSRFLNDSWVVSGRPKMTFIRFLRTKLSKLSQNLFNGFDKSV